MQVTIDHLYFQDLDAREQVAGHDGSRCAPRSFSNVLASSLWKRGYYREALPIMEDESPLDLLVVDAMEPRGNGRRVTRVPPPFADASFEKKSRDATVDKPLRQSRTVACPIPVIEDDDVALRQLRAPKVCVRRWPANRADDLSAVDEAAKFPVQDRKRFHRRDRLFRMTQSTHWRMPNEQLYLTSST